jgi:hypothetical protein
MGLTDRDFESIYQVLEKATAKFNSTCFLSPVIKRDTDNNLVWIKELGDQPIPLVAFDYKVKYYDTDSTGRVNEKIAKVAPVVPHIGDLVFVILERGVRRLPRCVGTIQSRNYIVTTLDDA